MLNVEYAFFHCTNTEDFQGFALRCPEQFYWNIITFKRNGVVNLGFQTAKGMHFEITSLMLTRPSEVSSGGNRTMQSKRIIREITEIKKMANATTVVAFANQK